MNNKHVLLALIFLGWGAYLTYLCKLNKSVVLLELIGTQHMHAEQMPLQKKMNLYFHTIKSIFISHQDYSPICELMNLIQ